MIMQKFTHWLKENENWLEENEEPEQWVVVFKNGPKAPEGPESLAYLPWIQGQSSVTEFWKKAQQISGGREILRIQSMDGKHVMWGGGVVKADRPLPNYN
jgi:hypothetical protein